MVFVEMEKFPRSVPMCNIVGHKNCPYKLPSLGHAESQNVLISAIGPWNNKEDDKSYDKLFFCTL